MLRTAHVVCLAMSQSRGTRVIQEWITGQRSKLSLVTSGLRNFLGYGCDKEFVVKSYVDASFYCDPDDSESQSRYVLKVGAII